MDEIVGYTCFQKGCVRILGCRLSSVSWRGADKRNHCLWLWRLRESFNTLWRIQTNPSYNHLNEIGTISRTRSLKGSIFSDRARLTDDYESHRRSIITTRSFVSARSRPKLNQRSWKLWKHFQKLKCQE